MSNLTTQLPTDTWVVASWDEYIKQIEDPAYEKAKGYYYNGQMRVEMLPVGSDHSCDHAMLIFAITLFATLRGIPLTARDNCTYRKIESRECQPDISYYVGDRARLIPRGTSIIDLDRYPAPDLAIEVADSSLLTDQGAKRLLYEDLQVAEYWVVDVQKAQILAYSVADRGSKRIDVSQVLPGLAIALLEDTLRHSQEADQTQAGAWLLSQLQ
ncbi:MAG: Uma2 family endonuclease [Tildeniella nuda ZEHNDER 1965/U140]|jgi:Uma2 family endonuclease|nr:Uma2 family endonuclease [Tildeniella nuda ZEHNDER 1965/U140]